MRGDSYLGLFVALVLVSLCYCRSVESNDFGYEEKVIEKLSRRDDSEDVEPWSRNGVWRRPEAARMDSHQQLHASEQYPPQRPYQQRLRFPRLRIHKPFHAIKNPDPSLHRPNQEKLNHEEGFAKPQRLEKTIKKHDKLEAPKPPPTAAEKNKSLTTDSPTQPPQAAARRQGVATHGVAVDSAVSMTDIYFLAIVAGCSVAGMVGVVVAGVCWYRFQKDVKATSEVEYPAYGVTGPNKERIQSPGDRKLAQSAQMYHYQHQKQQMIALEKANGEMRHDASDEDSEEENEEGDYTVYECPGLAPTGEMEVKNPLFNEDNNSGAPPIGGTEPVTQASADQQPGK